MALLIFKPDSLVPEIGSELTLSADVPSSITIATVISHCGIVRANAPAGVRMEIG
jgi:hypothetical protein